MTTRKGFTLIEIAMAMIVLGILAGIAVTNYNGIMISGAASAAEHNLMLIYSAQKNYFLKNDVYCSANCQTLTQINNPNNLNLNINDSFFSYSCNYSVPYCQATYNADNSFILGIYLKQQIVTK